MSRRGFSIFVVLATMASGLAAHLGHAASPSQGTLTVRNPLVEWSGGPLTGSAPAQRNTVCMAANCDDFLLDIRVPARAFKAPAVPKVVITLSTAAPNDIRLIVSAPGADSAIGSTDYTVFGTSAELMTPQSGVWRIRAACYACAAAAYTATARLVAYRPPALEPLAKGFGFFATTIAGPGIGEPGIAVNRRGHIFINGALNGPTGGGSVWRSLDGGRTWDVKQGLDDPGISGDTDLAIAPDDGTIYFMNLAYGPFSNMVYTSRDNGATYSGPSVAGADSDRQWFTAAPNGRVYVTYHDISAVSHMWVYRSDDHGATFRPVGNIALGAESMVDTWCGNHQAGRPQINPRNPDEYYVFYSTAPFADCHRSNPAGASHHLSQVWIARSSDAGQTFTHTKVYESDSNTDHNLMGLDIDAAGNLYIVIAESNGRDAPLLVKDPETRGLRNGEPGEATATAQRRAAATAEKALSTHVKLFVSKDKGATWGGPFLVDQLKDHHSNVFAAVSAGDAGRVNIAWYTSRASTFEDADATWTIAMAQSRNALSSRPTFTQTRVSPGVVHTGPICQAGLGCSVSGANRNLLDFMAIDTGPNGMAYVTWAADTSGEVKIQFARQTAGPSLKRSGRG